MPKSVPGFLCLLLSFIVLISIVLILEQQNKKPELQERRKAFQSAVGGVGIGAATTAAWNFGDYDSRMQPGGFDRSYPIPGGYSYSPDRLTMISGFQER